MNLKLDSAGLRRYDPAQTTVAPETSQALLPRDPDTVLIACGNSAEALAVRVQALAANDGVYLPTYGLNNDQLGPRPVTTDGTAGLGIERLVLGREQSRTQLRQSPLLTRRYALLTRGIPVLETYPLAGNGGHGFPVVSALDLDLAIDEVLAFLRKALRPLRGEVVASGGSDLHRLLVRHQQRQQRPRRLRVLLIGGGTGSFGPMSHVLLPYLVQHLLEELGIVGCELWGVVLGPQAFTGLTPFTRHNYRALLHSLDHQMRHGQQREYRNGLTIAMATPPYSHLFLLDDPQLPGDGPRVSERELDAFLDRSALSLALLLRGTVWSTIASHVANPDAALEHHDGRLRALHTVRAVLAGVDRTRLHALLTTQLEEQLANQIAQRLAS